MSSKFLTKKTPVEIEVSYLDFGDEVIVVTNEEVKKRLKDKIKTLKARFHRMNYRTYNAIMNASLRTTENGDSVLNPVQLRSNKLRNLLIEIEDCDGEKITSSEQLLTNLTQEVAIALVDEYDNSVTNQKFELLKQAGAFSDEILEQIEPNKSELPISEIKVEEDTEETETKKDPPTS